MTMIDPTGNTRSHDDALQEIIACSGRSLIRFGRYFISVISKSNRRQSACPARMNHNSRIGARTDLQ
jgi:hypothetical protein